MGSCSSPSSSCGRWCSDDHGRTIRNRNAGSGARFAAMEVMALSTGRPEHASGTAAARAVALAIVAAAGATTIALAMGTPGFLGPVVVAFVLVCPGLAIVRLLELREPLLEVVLGVTLSVALAGLVSATQLYLGAWSPAGTVAILVALTIGAELLDPVLVPRWVWSSLGRSLASRGPLLVARGRIIAAGGRLLAGDGRPEGDGSGGGSLPSGGSSASRAGTGAGVPGPPATTPPTTSEPLPPPPVVVVRRRPAEQIPVPTRAKKGRRRVTLGIDPLEQTKASRALRTTIEIVVDDLEDQRDEAGS